MDHLLPVFSHTAPAPNCVEWDYSSWQICWETPLPLLLSLPFSDPSRQHPPPRLSPLTTQLSYTFPSSCQPALHTAPSFSRPPFLLPHFCNKSDKILHFSSQQSEPEEGVMFKEGSTWHHTSNLCNISMGLLFLSTPSCQTSAYYWQIVY